MFEFLNTGPQFKILWENVTRKYPLVHWISFCAILLTRKWIYNDTDFIFVWYTEVLSAKMSHEQICHIFPLGVVLYGHVKIKYQKRFLKHSKPHICLPDALETAPSYFVKIPYPFQCSLYSMSHTRNYLE